MAEVETIPELKEILGAVLFAAKKPVTPAELATLLKNTAREEGGATEAFAALKSRDVEAALGELREDLSRATLGFGIAEVAGGYRLENDVGCGPWLRQFLQRGKTNRLTRPALETLAIIAYRQPCTRAEIEKVRGVAVDQIVRNLLELQLIRIAGRSELPGRPWLFGTTQKFLEHFGLNELSQLPGVEELRRMEAQRAREQEATRPAGPSTEPEAEPAQATAEEEEAAREDEVATAAYLAETGPEDAPREAGDAAAGADEPEKREPDDLDEDEDEDEFDEDDEDEDEDDDEDEFD